MFLMSIRNPKQNKNSLDNSSKCNMTLRYYYDLMSQPSRALFIIFRLSGIKYKGHEMRLTNKEHLTPEFKEINRFQKVPCIVHDEFKLSESVAILRYLSHQGVMSDQLYPKDLVKQVRVDEFLEWHHITLRVNCSIYFFKVWMKPLLTGNKLPLETIELLKHRMEKQLNVIEQVWLENNDFLTGPTLTAADIFAACEIEQTRMADYDVRIKYPKIRAWLKRVRTNCNPHYDEAHKLVYKISGTAPNAKL